MNHQLKQKIFYIADELAREQTLTGKKPTNKLIREKLGNKHSYSQIAPIFKEWKELRLGYRSKDTPTEIEEYVSNISNNIWNIALEKVSASFENQYNNLEKVLAEKEAEIYELNKKLNENRDVDLEKKVEQLQTQLRLKNEQLSLTLSLNEYELPNVLAETLEKHGITLSKFDEFLFDLNNKTQSFSQQIKEDNSPTSIIHKAYIQILKVHHLKNSINEKFSDNQKLSAIKLLKNRSNYFGGKIDLITHWFHQYDTYLKDYRYKLLAKKDGVNTLLNTYPPIDKSK